MAKYSKIIKSKAINSLDKFDKALYYLRIVKLGKIELHHEPYNYGQTINFKFNWLNPLTWVLVIFMMFSAIVCGAIDGIVCGAIDGIYKEIKIIKLGIITYFE